MKCNMNINKIIREKFRIKTGLSLPFIGRMEYTREDLVILLGEFGFKTGVEIGVYKGIFSRFLLENIPNIKLTCVDLWGDAYRCTGDDLYKCAVENTKGYDVELKRMPSLKASEEIEDLSLDFVNIDADHTFNGAMLDLILWSKKVRPGGIIFGHDYVVDHRYGVIDAVNSYTRSNNINEWYITREGRPSFFWVKK